MVDFGLLVGRYSASMPTIGADNEHRELRLDVNGRLLSRLLDDRDKGLRYFLDNEAVSGDGQDRGMVVMGLNTVDGNYQMLRLNDDGSLAVAFNAGVDASEAADKAAANDGEVALVQGSWALVQSKEVTSGKINIAGWSFASDKNAVFQLALAVAEAPTYDDVTEILDTQITTSARPSDHVTFGRALTKAGVADQKLCVFAKQLQAGPAGVGFSMLNAFTTT